MSTKHLLSQGTRNETEGDVLPGSLVRVEDKSFRRIMQSITLGRTMQVTICV